MRRSLWSMVLLSASMGFAAAQQPTPTEGPAPVQPPASPAKTTPQEKPAEKPKAAAKVKSIITVKVPADKAELMIMNQPTKATGASREFESPELESGKKYEYDFSVKFAPNNYTTITRTKSISFIAGEAVNIDFTKANPEDKVVIRFVPTPADVVSRMVELAKVTKDDVVYDLGCGDGRIVIAAVKEGNAKKGIGIDLDPERVKESKEAVKAAKLDDKVEIRQGDVLDIKDLSDATVVMMYMGDELGELLKPKLLAALKPGTRIVSHRFLLGDWKPTKTINVIGEEDSEDYKLHTWTVTQADKDKLKK
ncbi:MAG: TIGR03000 domain-containing protein [Gemmataceae bacterium]